MINYILGGWSRLRSFASAIPANRALTALLIAHISDCLQSK